MASFLLDAPGMGTRALVLLLATAACSADLDIEIGVLSQESASCNSREDCPAPPGRCEEVDFCEGVCHTHDKPGCQCEVSTECNDGNPCTQDFCGDATCSHQPITEGPGCCATVANCPAPNACQLAVCAQSSCSYLSNGHPGCCNTDSDCDGTACVNNTCGGTPPSCTADEQCGTNQTCVDGTCQNLSCECGFAQNHQCVAFECAPGCASCPEGEVCGEDHQCHAATGGADLGLSWGSLPPLIFPGEELTFKLTVTNHGPDAATQTVVSLSFPTPPKSPLPDGCSAGEGAVTCIIPALAVEASRTLEFHASAKSGVSMVTATLPPDSNSENNSATLNVSVVSESGGGGGGGGGCGGCGNESSVAGPVQGGLLWGVMMMLALRLGRRRR